MHFRGALFPVSNLSFILLEDGGECSCATKLRLLKVEVVCIPGRCPASPHYAHEYAGGTRPLHSISPGLYPPGDVGDGEAVHSATGHLSPATAWCQFGQSVDTDRGPGPGDPVTGVCPMYGPDPDNVGCAVVPWW